VFFATIFAADFAFFYIFFEIALAFSSFPGYIMKR